MKFFTTKWWREGCEDSAFTRYETYLNSVRALLPSELVTFDTVHTLHDAKVKNVAVNSALKTVTMALGGWDRNFKHRVSYTICFKGVSEFFQHFSDIDSPAPDLGDIGYWEFEAHDSFTEIRILFASSAEFRVLCTDFSYTHADQEC